MQTLTYEIDHDGVALVAIDVPGRSLNVLTLELQQGLDVPLADLSTPEAVKGIVIYSAKPWATALAKGR